jgi:biotin synthase
MTETKHNWTKEEILEIYNKPLMELMYDAATIHRVYHDPLEVQVSSLISIKTGGCSEDCGYCPQAARYHTGVKKNDLMSVETVKRMATNAKDSGASRVCLGAAWRNVENNQDFDKVLDMVKEVNSMNMEVCCTLGMLSQDQARRLREAGLYAYNHNLDSSEDFYKEIISTRGYEDRLRTIDHAQKEGIHVCSGGIIGMGEDENDRVGMLYTLSNMTPHPGSVPINGLVPVPGTPLEEQKPVEIWDMVRMIATARIVMPKAEVRLSAGRQHMSKEGQAMCFMAGASSIFAGDKLLTTANPKFNADMELFKILGVKPKGAFTAGEQPVTKDTYKEAKEEERAKWTRPAHEIDRNIEATEKGKLARRAVKESVK